MNKRTFLIIIAAIIYSLVVIMITGATWQPIILGQIVGGITLLLNIEWVRKPNFSDIVKGRMLQTPRDVIQQILMLITFIWFVLGPWLIFFI